LRVAALLAHVSGGVSDVERDVMKRLTSRLGLSVAVLDQALNEAQTALND
jgi:tellurite resistance protein